MIQLYRFLVQKKDTKRPWIICLTTGTGGLMFYMIKAFVFYCLTLPN